MLLCNQQAVCEFQKLKAKDIGKVWAETSVGWSDGRFWRSLEIFGLGLRGVRRVVLVGISVVRGLMWRNLEMDLGKIKARVCKYVESVVYGLGAI